MAIVYICVLPLLLVQLFTFGHGEHLIASILENLQNNNSKSIVNIMYFREALIEYLSVYEGFNDRSLILSSQYNVRLCYVRGSRLGLVTLE